MINTSSSNSHTSPQPAESGQVSPLSLKLASSRSYYWFLVSFLVLLSASGSFVNDMYSPALPGMCEFFGCSIPLAQMGLTTGMIGLALGQFVLGPVSDKYGRKPVVIGATLLFVIAAVASLFATSIHVFNICRLIQGLGASAGYLLAKTIPADVYSGRELAKLMTLVGAINGFAPASAPVLGGIMDDDWGWKSIFIFLASFSVIIIVVSLFMKESLPKSRRSVLPLFRSFGGYKTLLTNKPFIIHTCLRGSILGVLFAYTSSSPFIVQNHYGFSATAYGIMVGVNALFIAAGSVLSLKIKPYKKAALVGAMILGVGAVLETVALFCIHNVWIYDMLMAIMLFAVGMIISTANTLAMNEGRAKSGEAAAVLGVSGYIVGAVASPLVGMGDILHSTAYVNIALAVLVIIFAVASDRLPADLDK